MTLIEGTPEHPTIDPGLYIMTWQNPKYDYESICGFGGLDRMLAGVLELRWITETIAQNRIIRVREHYSFWDGYTRMPADFEPAPNDKLMTRSLDGKIILELKSRNKPVCPNCDSSVVTFNNLCGKCNILAQLPRVKKRNKTPKQSYKEFVKEWIA